MGRDDNKSLEERVDNLANIVFELNRSIKDELVPQLKDFSTTTEVQERLDALDKRQKRFTIFISVLVLVLAGVISFSGYTATTHEIQHRKKELCIKQNGTNQAIRDIVDRSVNSQQNYDVSKLSDSTKKVLSEIASATQEGNGKTFHDFVYVRTPIVRC